MNKRKLFIYFLLTMLCAVLMTNSVYANSAEPPCLTIVVVDAPDDLEVNIRYSDGSAEEVRKLKTGQRGWETYFRLDTFHPLEYSAEMLADAVVEFSCAEYSFECSLPDEACREYNNIVMLDREAQKLTNGTYPGRYALIVTLRILTILVIEGAVFILFRYREKRSWAVFFLLNLITQAALNIMLYGMDYESYQAALAYVFIEVVVFIAESLVYRSALREHGKGRAVIYAVCANAVSLCVGGLMISHLPL